MKKNISTTKAFLLALCFAFPFVTFSQDGSLDNTFGIDGIVTTSFGPYTQARLSDLALQADGKIVVIGYFDNDQFPLNDTEYRIIRYNINGSLDNSFGNNGIVNTSYDIRHVKIQTDGKILLQGSQNLARYNTNGSLDITFCTGKPSLPKIDTILPSA